MIKFTVKSLGAILFVLFASSLCADPIEDLSMKSYQAGWYPNFYKGEGPMTCPQTCEVWVGTQAEGEMSSELDEQTAQTSVCKVANDEGIILEPFNDPNSHWLYGNQFDSDPVCWASRFEQEPIKSELFMCLCVASCKQADLVVSKIYDPVWDNVNQVSVIRVEVTNIGSVSAGSFATKLADPGTGAASTKSVLGLAPNATVTLTFYFGYWVFDPDAHLIGTADVLNEVEECDEDNNALVYYKIG